MLPASRNRTYGTDTPVNPGDLNDLQDAIVAGKHGEISIVVPAAAAQILSLSGSLGTCGYSSGWSLGTGTATLIQYPLPLAIGDKITEWTAYLQKTSASGAINAQLNKHDLATDVVTNIGSILANSANNPGFITLVGSGLSEVVVSGFAYFIGIGRSTSVAGDRSLGAMIKVSRP